MSEALFANGGAYRYVNNDKALGRKVLYETLDVYESAPRTVRFVGLVFLLVGIRFVFLEKHIKMRVTSDTGSGLDQYKGEQPATVRNGEKA